MKSYLCEFFGEKSRPDSHKVKENPIFDPFVRTCSLFEGFLVNSYFASPFGEKSRPTSGLLSMLRSGVKILCVLYLHYNVAFTLK